MTGSSHRSAFQANVFVHTAHNKAEYFTAVNGERTVSAPIEVYTPHHRGRWPNPTLFRIIGECQVVPLVVEDTVHPVGSGEFEPVIAAIIVDINFQNGGVDGWTGACMVNQGEHGALAQ